MTYHALHPRRRTRPHGLGIVGIGRVFEEPYHQFWFHFGRFMHTYAVAEAELLFLLTHISGLSGVEAGVVFGGTGCDAARTMITKLLTATNQKEKQARLKYPFDQMAVIGTVRNHLVHWGAGAASDGTFTVSNAGRSPLKPMDYSMTIEDLKNMYHDLTNIIILLVLERNDSPNPPMRDRLLQAPWQFKRSQSSPS
jgi:hypothetical protein